MSDPGRELLELTRVRVLLFLREPEAIFWVFVFPLVLAAVLGFAFRSGGVEPVRVGLLAGEASAILARALAADEHLELVHFEERAQARKKLERAALDALLEPPETSGGRPRLSFDPARTEGESARLRVMRALEPTGGAGTALELVPVAETGARYVDFLFPGMLGMNLMGTGMWGIGFAIADVRRRKFLKRLLVTPMRRSSFFLSFLCSRLVFLALEVGVLTAFGIWVLGVPFRAGLAGFTLVCLLGAFTFAGIGILTASRARTIEAVSGLMNLVMMPMWLGSGVFFSYERFPAAVQPLLRLLPLTALNDALRALWLDGEPLASIAGPLSLLAAWGLLAFACALRIFRWE
jgi:ABC-type polysaccharide/polyol phosphate export permease